MSIEVVKQDDRLATIAISDIQVNPEALRGVNTENVQYLELANSIATRGVLVPIRVREVVDTETNIRCYQLIDGLQRYTGAKQAGYTTIDAKITSSDDEAVFEEQIIANVFRVETKPVEYTHQLRRILRSDPNMTMASLAAKIGKTDSWLKQRLQLTKLCPEVAQLVDGGQINLNNAYALCSLPVENQPELIEAAMNKTYQEFGPLADSRLKELNKARRAGKTDEPVVFEPKQALRKAGDISEEISSGKILAAISEAKELSTVEDGWKAALEWVLSLDPISVTEQRRKWEEAQAEQARKRAEAKKEREARSEKAGEIKAERMKLQLQLQDEGKTTEEIIKALADFDITNNVAPAPVRQPKPKTDEAAPAAADAPATSA